MRSDNGIWLNARKPLIKAEYCFNAVSANWRVQFSSLLAVVCTLKYMSMTNHLSSMFYLLFPNNMSIQQNFIDEWIKYTKILNNSLTFLTTIDYIVIDYKSYTVIIDKYCLHDITSILFFYCVYTIMSI